MSDVTRYTNLIAEMMTFAASPEAAAAAESLADGGDETLLFGMLAGAVYATKRLGIPLERVHAFIDSYADFVRVDAIDAPAPAKLRLVPPPKEPR